MDKIYSRYRVRLPRCRKVQYVSKRKRVAAQAILVILIAIITMIMGIRGISPILDKICEDVAITKATLITNQKTTEVMASYTYSDLVNIYKDSSGNVTMMQSNIITINEITSSIADKIQRALLGDDESSQSVRLGSFTGVRILAGIGPKVKIKFLDTGTVETSVRSEFESAGINQTIHRIYLDVVCNVSILTPYETVDECINNQVMLAENVVVGVVPSTYYNLEGMNGAVGTIMGD